MIDEISDFTGDVYNAKQKTINELIKAELDGKDLNDYKKMFKYISFSDILRYAKSLNYKWSSTDIGRNQKIDLIKSIVKRTK
jgi:hypothetical protein